MANITKNERAMLTAILDSEYHDGYEPVGNPVWVNCAMEPFGRSAGGIMASLVKKGLAGTDGESCWITRAGADVLGDEDGELIEVVCPDCQHRDTIANSGWLAIVCRGCGRDISYVEAVRRDA